MKHNYIESLTDVKRNRDQDQWPDHFCVQISRKKKLKKGKPAMAEVKHIAPTESRPTRSFELADAEIIIIFNLWMVKMYFFCCRKPEGMWSRNAVNFEDFEEKVKHKLIRLIRNDHFFPVCPASLKKVHTTLVMFRLRNGQKSGIGSAIHVSARTTSELFPPISCKYSFDLSGLAPLVQT